MEPVKVSMVEFTNDVNNGLTRKELRTKYNLSMDSVKAIAKKLGLEIKRDVRAKFELIDDSLEITTIEVVETPVVNSLNA